MSYLEIVMKIVWMKALKLNLHVAKLVLSRKRRRNLMMMITKIATMKLKVILRLALRNPKSMNSYCKRANQKIRKKFLMSQKSFPQDWAS
jgi:hypothetical protein